MSEEQAMVRSLVPFSLVLALGAACAINPATGERQFTLFPTDQEITMGRQAAEEVAQSIGIYQHGNLGKYVSDLGTKLAAVSERKDLPWTFNVVDDPAVNAFALPGGYVFVTRGILAHLENEAQLASALGHEIGHVTAKHAMTRLSKAQLAQIGIGLGGLIAPEVANVSAAGMGVLFLKFSREDENQADELGIRYAHRADFDVRQMPAVFGILKRVGESSGGDRLPSWLSTHPDPDERIGKTTQRIATLDLSHATAGVDNEAYLRLIDGMEFGANPRQGYFKGDQFLHPDLRFMLTFPAGWKKANLKEAVTAESPSEDAALQVTIAKTADPAAALQAFLAKEGVKASGDLAPLVPGLPSASGRFTATTKDGELAGIVTYVSQGGRSYEMLALTTAPKLEANVAAFTATHRSFAPLTDPAALAAQPAHLRVLRAPRALTLTQLYAQQPPSVPIATIALLNKMEPGTALTAGQAVKWVEGGKLP
jgi:predicted Zn-dependent protease